MSFFKGVTSTMIRIMREQGKLPPAPPKALVTPKTPKTSQKKIPKTPDIRNPKVRESRQAEKKIAKKKRGRKSTIRTSPQGLLQTANTAKKTLLGQ